MSLLALLLVGPDAYDNFADHRDNYEQTEPATYNNAPLIGVLARLGGGHAGYTHLQEEMPEAVSPQQNTDVAPQHKAPATSLLMIEQKTTSSWNSKGKTYYRYSTIVTNKSDKTLKDVKISVNNLYGPIWGLAKSGGSCTLPTWLPAGKSLEFVYIHASSVADVSVSSYTLA